MHVIYSDNARQGTEGYTLLQQATKQLETVIGQQSAARIQAEWDRTEDDRHRALYTLRLSDWTGAVSAQFAPDELQAPSQLNYRFHRVWGDLLQVRSHKQLETLIGGGQNSGE